MTTHIDRDTLADWIRDGAADRDPEARP